MNTPLADSLNNSKSRRRFSNRNLRRREGNKSQKKNRVLDKATIAAKLQLQEEEREVLYGLISLLLKLGLLAVFTGSFVKVGIASHQRIMRHLEISSVLKNDSEKLAKLNFRFDRLFTIGGQNRLIDEQEHLIAPNSKRIIWR